MPLVIFKQDWLTEDFWPPVEKVAASISGVATVTADALVNNAVLPVILLGAASTTADAQVNNIASPVILLGAASTTADALVNNAILPVILLGMATVTGTASKTLSSEANLTATATIIGVAAEVINEGAASILGQAYTSSLATAMF